MMQRYVPEKETSSLQKRGPALFFVLLSWLLIAGGAAGLSGLFRLGFRELWYYGLISTGAFFSLITLIFKHNRYRLAAWLGFLIGLGVTLLFLMNIHPLEFLREVFPAKEVKK